MAMRDILDSQTSAQEVARQQARKAEVTAEYIRANAGEQVNEFLDSARAIFGDVRLKGIRLVNGETIGSME